MIENIIPFLILPSITLHQRFQWIVFILSILILIFLLFLNPVNKKEIIIFTSISAIISFYHSYRFTRTTEYKFFYLINRNPYLAYNLLMQHKKWQISSEKPNTSRSYQLYQFYFWFEGDQVEEFKTYKDIIKVILEFDTMKRKDYELGWLKSTLFGIKHYAKEAFTAPSRAKGMIEEVEETKKRWDEIKDKDSLK